MAALVSKSQCPLEESRGLRCLVDGSVEMEVLKAVCVVMCGHWKQ